MDRGSGDYKPNANFVGAIQELRFIMKFLGIWQQPDSPGWYKLIWYVHSFGIAFDIFGPIAGLVVNRHDAAKTIDSLGFMLPTLTTAFQWMMFAVHFEIIGKILDFMEKDWTNLEKGDSTRVNVPASKQIMTRYYKTARIFLLTYASMLAVAAASCVRASSIAMMNRGNGSTDFEPETFLIPYSWYPVNLEQGYSYQIVFVAQGITALILGFVKAAIDNFFIVVTSNLCAQFEILRCYTESITYDSSRPGHCTAQVRLMIRRHQELLEAAERLQKSYSAIIAGQYASITVALCFIGYAITAEMERTDSSLAVLLKSGSYGAAFLQSIAVAEAVYNSDWHKCPRFIRLSLWISIARAQRPVIISGAGLMPMSLESFTNLMKASASYLSVLRAVGVTDG